MISGMWLKNLNGQPDSGKLPMTQQKDTVGSKIGMWLFLYTEIMLFGGLFVLYAVYLTKFPADFIAGGKSLSLPFGAVNTGILLVSSFAVAASITAIRSRKAGWSLGFIGVAMGSGIIFLINKYFEWGHKFELDIYPNSATLTSGPPGLNMFYGLYFVVTGLHGLHIVIGLILLGISFLMVQKGRISADNYVMLDNSGLYWHLVDLIWIFIFPLFYLIV
jgi:cytochrome c oxidase subunit 3